MIRGINHFAIEVRWLSSPYFERAICFVRPEYARMPKLSLHRAAQEMLVTLDAGIEAAADPAEEIPAARPVVNLPAWVVPALAAAGGVVIGVLIVLFLQ